jgi:drug/metabolite transporter (DMT)-like permease
MGAGVFVTRSLPLVAVSLWALNFSSKKYALSHGVPPLALTSVTYGVAATSFVIYVLVREGTIRIQKRHRRSLIVVAICSVTVSQIAGVFALKFADASMVALAFGSGPAIIAVLSHITGTERLDWKRAVAAVAALGGVVLVVIGSQNNISTSAIGVSLAFAAAGGWAAGAVAVTPLLRVYSARRMNAMVASAGLVPLWIVGLPSVTNTDWMRITPLTWAAVAFSILGSQIIANAIWYRSIAALGPSRAGIYSNLEPFLGALFAVVLLSEALTLSQILGGAVIALAIVLSLSSRSASAVAQQMMEVEGH